MLRGGSRDDRLPIQNRVPHQTMIAAVHVSVKGIEVERHNVTVSDRHIENSRSPQKILFSPRLSTYYKGSAVRVAPFEHDAGAIFRAIQASRAVGHAQPRSRSTVKRKILPKDVSVRRIAVRNRM